MGIHQFYKHHLPNFQLWGMQLSSWGTLRGSLVAQHELIAGSTSDIAVMFGVGVFYIQNQMWTAGDPGGGGLEKLLEP